ncbi:MAG: MarR family transcriptional regulator [Bacteroidetes bacterium]|nr:MarR family transcriptional regulator [Bacteroidota bacterium]MBL6944664.1 MarR family transcriptional regulator [Bacteroidales bacterium]
MIVEDTVDFHLRSTLFTMRRMYNLIAQKNGITQGIGYALINIDKEGIPATKIAPLMGMTSSSLSRLLKIMEDDGLVYRKPDKEDKRVVRIFLTIKGNNLRKKVEEVVLDFNDKLFKKLELKDLQAFERVNNVIKEQAKLEINEYKNIVSHHS